jgi:hypothetical protein
LFKAKQKLASICACIFLSTKGAYYGANYLAFYLLLASSSSVVTEGEEATPSISCLLALLPL